MATETRRVLQPGYTYERRVLRYSYLRRIPRRKRRVRVDVYETVVVTVPPRWKVVRVRVVREVRVTEAEARAQQLEAIRLGLADFVRAYVEWKSVSDYQTGIELQAEFEGFEVTEREMEIYHSSPADDSIHMGKLFVWPLERLPLRLDLSKRFGPRGKTPFLRVRIWFWVRYDGSGEDSQEVRLWCRTMTHPLADFKGAEEYAVKLWEQVQADAEEYNAQPHKKGETPSGWTPTEMVAWTAYLFTEKLPSRKSKKLGGSGG